MRMRPRTKTAAFAFAPGVGLRVRGSRAGVGHFLAEYGPALAARGAPEVEVRLGCGRLPSWEREHVRFRGAHKSVRWSVALSAPSDVPLAARVAVRGAPRSFALSLLQGYAVEPLISVAAARAGHVLVPGAALASANGGGAVLLLGTSRSGKSTLSGRALAAGWRVFGDDQVLVDRAGWCSAFPRRMRFYSDLPGTAPAAFARLPRRARAALGGLRAAKALTFGYVAPSLRIPAAALGQQAPPAPARLSRVVLVDRSTEVAAVGATRVDADVAVRRALELLGEQRRHIVAGARWTAQLEATRARERELLAEALAGVAVERLAIPAGWRADRAVAALERHVLVPS